MTDSQAIDWHKDIFDVLNEQGVSLVAHVPDAGHTPLIKRCEAANDIDVVTLTTEEEGIGLLSGAWAGGRKGVLLMQSSGVGNCANALALPIICRIPFLTIVSMRGEWGEFIPWQVPMGQGTPGVLEALREGSAGRCCAEATAGDLFALICARAFPVVVGWSRETDATNRIACFRGTSETRLCAGTTRRLP